jgi:Fic family protein
MATAREKLAASLEILKRIQASGAKVVEVATHPKLTRVHRERLQKSGFLTPIILGWDLISRPGEKPGDTTSWYASMESFVAAYANSRFSDRWQVTPELSLLRHGGFTGVQKQIHVHSPRANNQVLQLPHGCSLLLYKSEPVNLVQRAAITDSGLRLLPLEHALIQASPTFFERNPLEAQICLRRADVTELTRLLLDGGKSVVAGRIAGALRAIGREDDARQLLHAMRAADFKVTETKPFKVEVAPLSGARTESQYVQRIRAMWEEMRPAVVRAFADLPRANVSNVADFIADIEKRYVADAYNSLSIEGYQVTTELIERVRSGSWNPDEDSGDQELRNAMAAKGYFELHKRVVALIERSLTRGESPAPLFRKDFGQWYATLFSPSVQAGILKASALAGYRNMPVFIRNAQHAPMSAEAVRDCMPAFLEMLSAEPDAGARAVLGHFVFVYIHPYTDGNGRIARFMMNYMLCTGGYRWTIVELERREEYLQALDQASYHKNIEPLAKLVASFVRAQAKQVPTRPNRLRPSQ